jgi:hypothetical protein
MGRANLFHNGVHPKAAQTQQHTRVAIVETVSSLETVVQAGAN